MLRLLNKNFFSFSSIKQQNITDYVRRGKHRPKSYLQVGSRLYNFQLKQSQYFSDFDLTHNYLKHEQYSTQMHQLQCSEQNNTFSFVFNLNGKLSKPGINYSLQRLLVSGSRNYPIRNLLKQVRQRSFNNILYPTTVNQDFIMFSFSTPILKDFQNLLQVYSDMIFNPLLRQDDFKQLIWRYYFNKENQKLNLTGQLLQQMKENQYYQEYYIYQMILKHLFKQNNSTICKPQELINLKYRDLIKYYKQIFTINNLTLINHGDMNINYILDKFQNKIIQNKYIKRYQPIFSQQQKYNQNQLNNENVQNIKQSQTLIDQQLSNNQLNRQQKSKNIQFNHMKPYTILLYSFKLNHQIISQQQTVLLSILSYLLFDMPDSPFMKFNTSQTPYPINYGYKNRYFNIGITFHVQQTKQRQKIIKQKQSQIFQVLTNLSNNKISSQLIQKCLTHLQSSYLNNQNNGLTITQNILNHFILKSNKLENISNKLQKQQNKSLKTIFNVSSLIDKLLKTYKKTNIFENLIKKHLLPIINKNYVCFKGYTNYLIVQNSQFQRNKILKNIQQKLTNQQISQILLYRQPTFLQDIQKLPQIKPNQLQFFEDTVPIIDKIQQIPIYYQNKQNGIKITIKSDISDLNQQLFPFLQIFCKAYAKMGIKSMKDNVYNQMLNKYINKIQLKYQTQKDLLNPNQMKVYLFMSIQFNDRYFQYGFNILNGLISDFNSNNIFQLSKLIQKTASQYYHSISQDTIAMHGKFLAASKSPFVYFQNPIFNSRSITSMASDLRKVNNPKQILYGIKYQLQQIYVYFIQKSRINILIECKQNKKQLYYKYLNTCVKLIKKKGQPAQGISIQNFPTQKWLKYFPNFQQQLVFQSFKFPYFQKNSAASLLYSSIVNRNILKYNKVGGSFIYKGALISYLQGSRKKVLELQNYYKKIQQIDHAKRSIIQRFKRYTVKDMFESGVSIQKARFFKQAIIACDKSQIQNVMNQYVIEILKKGDSSILCIGSRLQNYQPLLKKGWEIQRPVDDLSLNVESYSSRQPNLRLQDYTKIC